MSSASVAVQCTFDLEFASQVRGWVVSLAGCVGRVVSLAGCVGRVVSLAGCVGRVVSLQDHFSLQSLY